MTLNYARNRNKVVELAEGLTTYILASRQGMNSEARVGQPYGTLYGMGFERRPMDKLSTTTGCPWSTTPQIIGNIQPDWTGGMLNTFKFKGFTLTALVDAKWVAISTTKGPVPAAGLDSMPKPPSDAKKA